MDLQKSHAILLGFFDGCLGGVIRLVVCCDNRQLDVMKAINVDT